MGRTRRNDASYSRKPRKGTRRPRPFFLIVCEGKKTEVDYFESFPYRSLGMSATSGQVYSHSPVRVIGNAGQHQDVVRRAVKEYQHLKGEYGISPQDVWCVFDCDHDLPALRQAIQAAKNKGFNPIYSIQCFELWYLLHFQQLTVAIDKRDYDKLISRYIGMEYTHGTKGMYLKLASRQHTAIRNARQLWETKMRHSEELSDPITNVFMLVEALNNAHNNRRP